MKGLLLKDLYMAKKYGRIFLVCILVFLALSVFGSNSSFFMIYLMVFTSMLPVTLISYDERSRWDIYSDVFPWSRAQIVSSKYLMTLILVGGMWVLSALVQCVRTLRDPAVSWNEMSIILSALLVLGVFSSSMILPVIFKFGSEKGRIVYYAVIIVVCGACAALSIISTEMNFRIPLFWLKWLPVFTIIFAICIFAGSWMLSIRFYEKREL